MILLWGSMTFPRPRKEFWIILIAYSQMIIFLKLLMMNDLFWWKGNVSLNVNFKEKFNFFLIISARYDGNSWNLSSPCF